MSTDLETDLRREFDAVRAPSGLTFSPESVLRQGSRTIRRHRIIAAGSAAMAVALVAGGAALTRPHDTAMHLPASHTATTGITLAQTGHMWGGQSEVRFNRDATVQSNVRYSIVGKDGHRHELGESSTHAPGQKPTAAWKSGMVDGHPVTLGVYPGRMGEMPTIVFANGISYPVGAEQLKDTGYMMFYVDYSVLAVEGEPARPPEIASIRWSSPSGVIDGIEGDHQLIGRVFTLSETLSVDVVLRPAEGGRTTVYGQNHMQNDGARIGFNLTAATTDPAGVAVATGRTPVMRQTALGVSIVATAGAPMAAGILPRGSSNIGVILTTGDAVAGLPTTDRLPDGRVIFAINGDFSRSSDPSKDSVKAVTWTKADGTQGWIAVNQKQG